MKEYSWNEEKNKLLKQERGISFEEIVQAIAEGKLIANIKNPNTERYPSQSTFIVFVKNYIYCVPYVADGSQIFLKTIFPSRKMKKQYLGD